MTPKQIRFVQEYLIDLNATQAAIRAGYSAKTAHVIGHQNLSKLAISAALAEAQAKRAAQAGVDALWVLNEAVAVYREAREVKRLTDALRALDVVGKHIDVQAFKAAIEHTGKDGGPIQIDQVNADADAFRSRLLSGAATRPAAGGTGSTKR